MRLTEKLLLTLHRVWFAWDFSLHPPWCEVRIRTVMAVLVDVGRFVMLSCAARVGDSLAWVVDALVGVSSVLSSLWRG